MSKILLITHQTSKTGAPISALLVFKELVNSNKNFILDVLSLSGNGELQKDYQQISSSYFYPEKYFGYKKTFYEKILSFIGVINYKTEFDIIEHQLSKKNYDLIYSNTIVSLPIGASLKTKMNSKLICHIHELEYAINECLPDFDKYKNQVDIYIVPSELNKKLLIEKFDIDKEIIKIIRETTTFPSSNFEFIKDNKTFNVYMCGTANWRKGEDLFLQLANNTVMKDRSIHFYWIGIQSKEIKDRYTIELKKINTTDNIHFIGEQENVYSILNKMDCFALTSREDPFPLAAIEAGVIGLPIICFNKGNGISEVLEDKDLIVEYLNIEMMSNKIIELKENNIKYKDVSLNNIKTFLNLNSTNVSFLIQTEINKLLKIKRS